VLDVLDEFLEARWAGDDGDGIGRLTIRASASGFAGIGSAWFNRERVLEFADEIGSYPLDPGTEPTIDGGYGSPDAMEVLVGLRVYPIGSAGQIGVRTDLASDVLGGDPARQCTVDLVLMTAYEALGRFSRELRYLVEGRVETARLDADRLE
jgi:hypothetical protein